MLALLAQARAGGPPPNGDAAAAGLALFMAFYCGLIAVVLGLQIWLFLTLSKTLAECSPRNRTMEPGMVWLNFVPLLNLVWIFLTIIRVSESLRNEYEDRDLAGDDDFGQTMGLVHAIGMIVCGISFFVTVFLYRSKIMGYRRRLEESEPRGRGRSRRDDDDDRDDDRGRRRRDDRDDDRE